VGDLPRLAISLEQHPFTIASSAAHPQRLGFTIKELGDFTSSIGQMKPGTAAYLDGPYGAFTIDESSRAIVMSAGGIGITPMMSIIRTLRDERDQRPLLLIYAVHSLDCAVYGEELCAATAAMNLRIVHVLEQPPDDWTGERGYITRDLLQRQIAPLKPAETQFLICGPPPMMNVVEQSLLDLNTPMWNIRAERFDIV
jgi:predicted ferric reductase